MPRTHAREPIEGNLLEELGGCSSGKNSVFFGKDNCEKLEPGFFPSNLRVSFETLKKIKNPPKLSV